MILLYVAGIYTFLGVGVGVSLFHRRVRRDCEILWYVIPILGYCSCLRLCVSVCVNHELVCAMTFHLFRPEPLNSELRCKLFWLRPLFVLNIKIEPILSLSTILDTIYWSQYVQIRTKTASPYLQDSRKVWSSLHVVPHYYSECLTESSDLRYFWYDPLITYLKSAGKIALEYNIYEFKGLRHRHYG